MHAVHQGENSGGTAVHAFVEGVARWPSRPALIFEDQVLTFDQLLSATIRSAGNLVDAGVGGRSKVAVLSANRPSAMTAALAALYVGATWVPINYRDAPGEVGAVLQRANCDVLIYSEDLGHYVDTICAAAPGLRVLRELAELEKPPSSHSLIAATPDRPAGIFYTGGTTGRPKGVVFLHRNLRNLVDGYRDHVHEDGDVILASAPLTHFAGRQCLASLTAGATTVIMPRFDPPAVLEMIERHRVTTITLAPTMLYMLLDEPSVHSRDLSSLRSVIYGSAPISLTRLKEAINVFGPVLRGAYGQTESPMLISSLSAEEHVVDGHLAHDDRLMSVGRPTPASDVRIIDVQGEEVPVGAVGEVVVSGNYQMHEYYQDPKATAAARWGEHLRTGDLGSFDQDGYLTIRGRIKEMIITGGFNVYCAEVEQALAAHEVVSEAAVFGVPDPLWGETVNATVSLRDGMSAEQEELQEWVRTRLGSVKTPKRIFVMSQLPRNANGKILKRELAALAASRADAT